MLSSVLLVGWIGMVVQAGMPVMTVAGPRRGEVGVVQVEVGAGDVDRLTREGFDVASVKGGIATVYVTEAERVALTQQGYVVRSVVVGEMKAPSGYETYDEVTARLQQVAAAHGAICRLCSLGTSVGGRSLWAMLITRNPDVEEDEPELRYVGAIHGDEYVGAYLCLQFIDLLADGYGTNARVTSLVNGAAVWVVPVFNPDGYVGNRRYNGAGYDLNRSFPVYGQDFTGTLWSEALDTSGRQPEVAAMMRWTAERRFVLSAGLHGGALVVNYPYDDDGKPSGADAPSPDDDLFRWLATQYSMTNPGMWSSTEFSRGITNGSAWYVITGGVQDWSYRYAGCSEVTIEVGEDKAPVASALGEYWADNEESMLRYAECVGIGVRGVVRDWGSGTSLDAKVQVEGNAQVVYTDAAVGDYHRLLLPGVYRLRYTARGHVDRVVDGVGVASGAATRVDVSMVGGDGDGDGRVTAMDIQWVTRAVMGEVVPYECDLDGGGVGQSDLDLLVGWVLGRGVG